MRHLRTCALAILVIAGAIPVRAQQPAPPPQPQPRPQLDFTFRENRSHWAAISITGGPSAAEFAWPATPGPEWDTALLAVGVATAAEGTPYVEIATGTSTERQYFATGDGGARWLNMSHLRGQVTPGTRVTLRAEGMTIGTGTTTLRLFASNPDLDESILVLAPHPDDAEIGAFGLYANRRATVATVTAGNAGANTYAVELPDLDVAAQYQFKGRQRVIDSITIPWQGGVSPERAINLGYFDARLAQMHAAAESVVPEMYGPNTDIGFYRAFNLSTLLPARQRTSTWRHLVEDIETLLEKVNPKVIAAPHPQLDTHRDHQFTTVALVEALERWGRDVTLLLYTNHADGNRYPYGPAGTLMSLPQPVAQAVEFDRIFSLPVPIDVQQSKLFALESMHDLRHTPAQQYRLAIGEGRTLVPEAEGGRPDATYLRRGPRANELFFVYDQDTVKPMIEMFLVAARARGAN